MFFNHKSESVEMDPLVEHLNQWRYLREVDIEPSRYFSSNSNQIVLNKKALNVLLKDAAEFLSYTDVKIDNKVLKKFFKKIGDQLLEKLMIDKSWLAPEIEEKPNQVTIKKESNFYNIRQKNAAALYADILYAYLFGLHNFVFSAATKGGDEAINKKFKSNLDSKQKKHLKEIGYGSRFRKDQAKLFKKSDEEIEKLKIQHKPIYDRFNECKKIALEYYEKEYILTLMPSYGDVCPTDEDKKKTYLDIFFEKNLFRSLLDFAELSTKPSQVLIVNSDGADVNRIIFNYYLNRNKEEFFNELKVIEDKITKTCQEHHQESGGEAIPEKDMNAALYAYFLALMTSVATKIKSSNMPDFLKSDFSQFINHCKNEVEKNFIDRAKPSHQPHFSLNQKH